MMAGNFRVMMMHCLWNKNKVIIFKLLLVAASICFVYLGIHLIIIDSQASSSTNQTEPIPTDMPNGPPPNMLPQPSGPPQGESSDGPSGGQTGGSAGGPSSGGPGSQGQPPGDVPNGNPPGAANQGAGINNSLGFGQATFTGQSIQE